MGQHLKPVEARTVVLGALSDNPQGLPRSALTHRAPRHAHAILRTIEQLREEGQITEQQGLAVDRAGRIRPHRILRPATTPPVGTPIYQLPGLALRNHRRKLGISATALGAALEVSASTVLMWEKRALVPASRLPEVIRALHHLRATSRPLPEPGFRWRATGNLRQLRNARELTQAQLANKLGVSQSTISAWEIGRATPSGLLLMQAVTREIPPRARISSDWLRTARQGAGWTQLHLAQQIGVTRLTISRWETGRVAIPAHRTETIRSALRRGVSDVAASGRSEGSVREIRGRELSGGGRAGTHR